MKSKLKGASFDWQPFSDKQNKLLRWWLPQSPHHDKDMVIAEGAIRSGKTVSMIDSFVTWSLSEFEHENFIIAGKSIGALKRNVLEPMFKILNSKGIKYKFNRSDTHVIIGSNTYYCFGANNEASQDTLQGLTAAGAYADEVALMPRSFVEQMIGRCSVEGRRYFMNCNPAGPFHWFKTEFIDKAEQKGAYVLHFDMDDNLSLSEKVKDGLKRMFTGVFYSRYILGLWVMAEGIVYDMFDREKHIVADIDRYYSQYYVGIDYGTMNPTTFGLWGEYQGVWYKIKEYFYDGRKNPQKTDSQFSKDLSAFVGDLYISGVVVDPSAASFITQLEEDGFYVIKGNNDVIDGIRNVGAALIDGLILYTEKCQETFKEFESYVWDAKAAQRGLDIPVKTSDHCLDSDRYFVRTILFGEEAFVSSVNI